MMMMIFFFFLCYFLFLLLFIKIHILFDLNMFLNSLISTYFYIPCVVIPLIPLQLNRTNSNKVHREMPDDNVECDTGKTEIPEIHSYVCFY